MQPPTPIRPVNGTLYEAVQILRPHPKIRLVSAPCGETHTRQNTATPDVDRWSVPSGTTIVDSYRPETPHLYTSRRQYEVANSRTLGSLGRLDTDISPKTPDSMSPMFSPLSPMSMIGRAKALLSPRSSTLPKMPDGEKVHGAFCRTKSVVSKTLSRRERGGVAEARSWNSLRSGFYSASKERLHMTKKGDEMGELEALIVSDEPPQIAPLRPVSKILPDLMICVPANESGSSIVIEHNSIKDTEQDGGEGSDHNSLRVASLRLHSSSVTSVLKDDTTAETSFYTAGETSFYYTPNAKDDDDVFINSGETSQTGRPMTSFMAKLQDAMGSNRGYKTPSIAFTTHSHIVMPSPSPKLRHTALHPKKGLQSGSLRAQYTETKIASSAPDLSVPTMWQLNHKESTRNLRVTPSLEKGLHMEDLEVFEENVFAAAAPILRGVEPDIVDVRRSQAIKRSQQQSVPISNYQRSDLGLEVAPLRIAPKSDPAGESSVEPSFDVPTIPFEILHTIVFSAAYGDAQCRSLAIALYEELTGAKTPDGQLQWGARKQRLLLQSSLLQELYTLKHYGFLRDDIFAVVRGQIFPTTATEMLSNPDFTNYIRRAVSSSALAEERAEEILGLAIDVEDENFAQTSPEEEAFFVRQPFNPQGFVYNASSDDGYYERLGSLPSAVSTFEEPQPQQEQRTGWRTSFCSKVAQVLRFGHWKRTL